MGEEEAGCVPGVIPGGRGPSSIGHFLCTPYPGRIWGAVQRFVSLEGLVSRKSSSRDHLPELSSQPAVTCELAAVLAGRVILVPGNNYYRTTSTRLTNAAVLSKRGGYFYS